MLKVHSAQRDIEAPPHRHGHKLIKLLPLDCRAVCVGRLVFVATCHYMWRCDAIRYVLLYGKGKAARHSKDPTPWISLCVPTGAFQQKRRCFNTQSSRNNTFLIHNSVGGSGGGGWEAIHSSANPNAASSTSRSLSISPSLFLALCHSYKTNCAHA